MRKILLQGSAALALVVAGCGGQEELGAAGDGGDQRRIDACGLATPAEIGAIVGTAMTDTTERFNEYTYTTPTTYTASCHYIGAGEAVMVIVHYPVVGTPPSSAELAARVTEHIRSQEESDSAIAELYRTLQVRPIGDLPAPAAEYDIAGQTTLEARVGDRTLQVVAGSSDAARRVARTVIERLD